MSAGQQPLNAMDRGMLVVDRSLRELGQAGWQTQTLVWLRNRIDVPRLRQALDRFALCHPTANSRLLPTGSAGRPVWAFDTLSPWPLVETTLPGASAQCVLDHAAQLMTSPEEAQGAPLRVHLLHRPAGDVFLLHFDHSLMDHSAVARVLREIDRCWRDPESVLPVPVPRRDPIVAYLQRFAPEHRRQATKRYLADLQPLWHGAVRLAGGTQVNKKATSLGVIAHSLEPRAKQALEGRIQALGAMPSLSMAILASAFRVLGKMAGLRQGRTDLFHAGIGVDLGLRGRGGPVLGNLMSMLSILVRSSELADRDQLTRLLCKQLRDRVAGGGDLAMLRLAATCGRLPRRALWIMDAFLRYGFSLWYAYFGTLDPCELFCGSEIEQVCSVGPCWPAIGVTLLVNQFRGRLLLQTTYVPTVIPEPQARAFLDAVVDDLMR